MTALASLFQGPRLVTRSRSMPIKNDARDLQDFMETRLNERQIARCGWFGWFILTVVVRVLTK
jgi:hypothetical protein